MFLKYTKGTVPSCFFFRFFFVLFFTSDDVNIPNGVELTLEPATGEHVHVYVVQL